MFKIETVLDSLFADGVDKGNLFSGMVKRFSTVTHYLLIWPIWVIPYGLCESAVKIFQGVVLIFEFDIISQNFQL